MKNSKFLRSKNLLKSLEAEELKSLNDERQEMKDNGNIDSVSERYRSHRMTDGTERCPTKTHAQHLRHDGRGGFTLVELVITIAIVIILSVISVPIYRGYVDKAKLSEGYALLGVVLSAQKAYYSEYGNFYQDYYSPDNGWTTYNSFFGIDARGNKYFTLFQPGPGSSSTYDIKNYFFAYAKLPSEYQIKGSTKLSLVYSITSGATIVASNKFTVI